MQRFKRIFSFLLTLAFLMTMLVGCAGTAATTAAATTKAATTAAGATTTANIAPMKLIFATHLAESHPITMALYKFRDRVKELSGGKITIETHINTELGDPTEVIDQIRSGVIDGGYFTTGHMAYYNKKMNATMWPFMFISYDHAKKAYAGELGTYMKKMAADGGFKVLDWLYYGFRNLSSKKPVNSVADIKGMKIRVPSERVNQLTMTAYGATCTTIAFSELYLALSQGVVDGQENPLATMDSANIQEVNKFIAMIEYTFFTTGMVVNPAKFNAYPAAVQEILTKASSEAAAYERDIFVEAEGKVVEKFKKAGVTFTFPDKAAFAKAAEPALAELKKDYDAAFVTEWLALVESSKK